jgi:hypothetical protein
MKYEVEYESGFRWVANNNDHAWPRLDLIAPSGCLAAWVSLKRNFWGYQWFVWDEDGVGGENTSEETIELAMITAESAVLRWGKHPL